MVNILFLHFFCQGASTLMVLYAMMAKTADSVNSHTQASAAPVAPFP